jgi:DNA-binding transcriptional MerR regulator
VRAGEAAQRAGVNVETLRYYERRGLLPEPVRAPGGHRRYDEDAVRFLRAIKDTQALGFTLAEIEDYLRAVRRGRAPASEALRTWLAAKIDEIDARVAGLRRMRGELARIVGCRGRGDLGRAAPPRTVRPRGMCPDRSARTAVPGPGVESAA